MLFRPQVFARRRFRLEGQVEVTVGIKWSVLTIFFSFFMVGVISFALVAEFAKKETASGLLVPNTGLTKIYALKPGRVTSLLVNIGDKVTVGTALAQVEVDNVSDGGVLMAQAELSSVMKQQKETSQQIEAQKQQFLLKQEALKLKIAQLQSQIDKLHGAQQLQTQTINLIAEDANAAKQLAQKGFTSRLELNRRLAQLHQEQQNMQELLLEENRTSQELHDAQAQLNQLPVQQQMTLSDLENQMADLDRREAGAETHGSYMILSPTSGIVDLIQISEGQQVAPSLPMMSILPENALLYADLFVPSRAIAYLKPGQSVRISYDAFPYTRFGFAQATIKSVSYTLLNPEEIPTPLVTREPVYRVRAELIQQSMMVSGIPYPLRPGMTLSAEIILDQHTLLDWGVQTIVETWNRAR